MGRWRERYHSPLSSGTVVCFSPCLKCIERKKSKTRSMVRLLLLLCRVLLLATLLFWVWLLWDQPDPEEKRCQQEWSISVSRFTGFHDCPLSEERWHTLQMTIRTGCCFLMIVLTFHLI